MTGKLKEFDITISNKPGSLAELCDQLAANAVNIKAIATDSSESVRLITSDESTTRSVLSKARLPWTETDTLAIRLLDRPGELAKVARMLAKESINIDAVYLLGGDGEYTDLVIKPSNVATALRVLG